MKAVVFVDVQNDFTTGPLAFSYPMYAGDNTKEDVDNSRKQMLEFIKNFAMDCRAAGYSLYATADTHPKTEKNIMGQPTNGYLASFEGKRLPVEHCIENTEGHKIIDGLVKDKYGNVLIPQGHIVDKPTFGSFDLLARIDQDFQVDTEGKLTRMSKYDGFGETLDEIMICGFCTSICVISNALMLRAKYPGVKITIMSSLCGDISKESHEAALAVMKNCQIDVDDRCWIN